MDLRESIQFEHTENKDPSLLQTLGVFLAMGVVVWAIVHWWKHRSLPPGFPIGALSIYLMFGSQGKRETYVISMDKDALTIGSGRAGNKLKHRVLKWEHIQSITRKDSRFGLGKRIEFLGVGEKAVVPAGVFKKDLFVLLNAIAQGSGFRMMGFEKSDLVFGESELRNPENAKVRDYIGRNAMEYPV